MVLQLHDATAAEAVAERGRVLLGALREGICVIDAAGRITAVSERFCELTGFARCELVGRAPPFPFWPPGDEPLLTHVLQTALGARDGTFEAALARADGSRFPALVDVAELAEADGPAGILCVVRDDTDQMRVREESTFRARLLDEVDAAVIATDVAGVVTVWNDGAEERYGWTRAEATGRPIAELTLGPQDAAKVASIVAHVHEHGRWEGLLETRHKNGTTVPAHVRTALVTDEHGEPTSVVGVSVAFTPQIEVERELHRAHDYMRAVAASMGEGLITVDTAGSIDYVNPAAERMLGWAHEELHGRQLHETAHFRHADGSLYLPADCSLVRARRDQVSVRVEEDMFVRKDGTELPIAYTSAPIEMAAGVMGAVIVFSDISERKRQQQFAERDREALTWLTRIREALEHDRFRLHAQPIIELATGATVQHELLIRMLDAEGGLVPPGVFLPVAEEYGSIREIDRWVVHEAAALAAAGHAIELNLSAESLGDPGLFAVVQRELEEAGADPALVVVELTETALLRNDGVADEFIAQLGELGCRVALDDFGTGYGGFSYVKRLPVDFLKIDIEFVRDLPRDPASRHVVRAIVQLAKDFGYRTVAEGVEDDETLDLLRDFGVDYAQGYGIGRPAPVEDTALGRPPRARDRTHPGRRLDAQGDGSGALG